MGSKSINEKRYINKRLQNPISKNETEFPILFYSNYNQNNPVVILRFAHPAIVPIEDAVLFELF